MPGKNTDDTTLLAPEQIADTVYAVFLTHGYDGTTFPLLAERLQVPVEALAARYSSTYAVWYAALCQATEDLFKAVNEVANAHATSTAPLDQLRLICRVSLEHSLQHPQAHRFIAMPRSSRMQQPDQPAYGVIAYRALMKRLVKRCIKEKIFAQQSPEKITQSIFCLLHGVTEFLLNIQRIPWEEGLPEHLLETYFAGLRPRGDGEGTLIAAQTH